MMLDWCWMMILKDGQDSITTSGTDKVS